MANCDGGCCEGGVWVDLNHRDVILAHADVIARHMTADQERDPSRWFEAETPDDPDFPSGKAAGTEASASGCVFLNAERRCVLHLVDDAERLGVTLKPFFCRIFPVTLTEGVLMLDDPISGQRPQCCSRTGGGTKTVFDVCQWELEVALGKEGLEELRMLDRESRPSEEPR